MEEVGVREMLGSLYRLIMFVYMYGGIACGIACVALGIVVVCTKEKITKLLGYFFIGYGIQVLLSSIRFLLQSYLLRPQMRVDVQTFNSRMMVIQAVSALAITAAFISLVMYVIRRYQMRWVIALVIFGVITGPLLSTILRVIMLNSGEPQIVAATKITFLNLMSQLPAVIMWGGLLIIFLKNRKKEDSLKYIWLLPCTYLFSSLTGVLILINELEHVADQKFVSDNIFYLYYSMLYLLMVVLCIYIVRKGKKAVRA